MIIDASEVMMMKKKISISKFRNVSEFFFLFDDFFCFSLKKINPRHIHVLLIVGGYSNFTYTQWSCAVCLTTKVIILCEMNECDRTWMKIPSRCMIALTPLFSRVFLSFLRCHRSNVEKANNFYFAVLPQQDALCDSRVSRSMQQLLTGAFLCVFWTTIKKWDHVRHSSAGAEIFFHTKIENWVKKAPFLEWMKRLFLVVSRACNLSWVTFFLYFFGWTESADKMSTWLFSTTSHKLFEQFWNLWLLCYCLQIIISI